MASTHHSNKSITPTNLTTNFWFSKREKRSEVSQMASVSVYILFFPPRHKSLPAPQDKVYLQQSPAVVTKAARQQYRTGSFFAPCYTSIWFDAFKLEAAQRQVKTSTSCWMLLKRFHLPFWLPPCLENWNKPPLHVTLAVVWHISYCGESNNVTLCETYSAYQRFFAVQTIAHWHLFFYPYLWESRADPGSVI